MALTTCFVSYCPGLSLPPISNSKKARISSCSAFPAFFRKDVEEKLRHIGMLRNLSVKRRKQHEWVLQASSKNKVAIQEEITVPPDSTGTTNVEQNSSGPPVLTIIAGLVVLAGFLWVVGSALLWFVGLLFG